MSHSDAEIRELLRNLRKPDKLDLAYPITATEDDLVALIKEQTRLARIERDNNARYVLHSILSDDVDSELDHSDIEALFEVRLTTTESPLKPVKEDI